MRLVQSTMLIVMEMMSCGTLVLLGQNTFPSSGNVGIGTTSPVYLLDILGSGQPDGGDFHVKNLVNSGLGPRLILDNSAGFGLGSLDFYTIGGANPLINLPSARWLVADDGNYSSNLFFQTKTTGSGGGVMNTRLSIFSSGNVGIGTGQDQPAHLLQVAGTIGAKEVIVSSTGADYVFNPNYHLRPLTEVRRYIQENHHLPDIPSAAQVKESGVSLGEMQTKLLAKIEELTLHIIQVDERNRLLEQHDRQLEERLAQLEGRNSNR